MDAGKRNPRIGILIGACIIVGGAYSTLFGLSGFYIMVLLFIIGGFVPGVFFSRKMWDGIWLGLLSGIAGASLIIILILGSLISDLIHGLPTGFATGMVLLIGVFLSLAAIVLAATGGGVGGLAKWALFKDSKENQGNSP